MNDKLSDLNFDEIKVGNFREFKITITNSMVDEFAKISGDFNPLHVDENMPKQPNLEKE